MIKNQKDQNPVVVGIGICYSKPFYMLTTASYQYVLEIGGTEKKNKFDIHMNLMYMNGCDVSDQLQASYNTNIPSRKWWIRFFFFHLTLR